jgi:hypothetical protein
MQCKPQERELVDRLVQFLEIKCNPARVETVRDTGETRLTSGGLEWCDARCVKQLRRHYSEISLKGWRNTMEIVVTTTYLSWTISVRW